MKTVRACRDEIIDPARCCSGVGHKKRGSDIPKHKGNPGEKRRSMRTLAQPRRPDAKFTFLWFAILSYDVTSDKPFVAVESHVANDSRSITTHRLGELRDYA
jgi:hypothetical protein